MRTASPALWTDPQVGDICTTSQGKTRTVRSAGVGKVAMEDQDGNLLTVTAGSWATWCARAVKQGGKYERVGDV